MSEANPPEKRYIINPNEVTSKEELRAWEWATAIMSKHEYLFKPRIRNKQIIARNFVKAEDIDIRSVYPFARRLNWMIYRNDNYWSLMLRSGKTILMNFNFAKIDQPT